MKMNHMNLVVPDVKQTAAFFEKFFQFKPSKIAYDMIAVMHGRDGFVLVISNFSKAVSPEYPHEFHIGFYQDTEQEVVDLYNALVAEGVVIEAVPKRIRDRFGFYFYAPGRILTEITCAAEG